MTRKIIIYVLMTSFFIAFYSCKQKETEEHQNESGVKVAESNPVKVEGTIIRKGNFPVERISNGKLHSKRKADLTFRSSGVLSKIYVKNGDRVQEGDLIAEIEHSDLEIALEKAKIALEQAKIQRSDLIVSHHGNRDTSALSKEAMLNINIKSNYLNALLNLKQAEKSYQEAFLKAPFAGLVCSLEAQAHNRPETSKAFCSIMDDSKYTADFPVLETDIDMIKIGMPVEIRPYVLHDSNYKGRIIDINPLISEHGMIEVKAEINQADSKLYEGMNVKVHLEKILPDVFIIPKSAVVYRNLDRKVSFLYRNGKSVWTYVDVLKENSSHYAVTFEEEVAPGDTVISSENLNIGYDFVVEMQVVHDK